MAKCPPSNKKVLHLVHTWRSGIYHYFPTPLFCNEGFAAVYVAEQLKLSKIYELLHIEGDSIRDPGELILWTYDNGKWEDSQVAQMLAKDISYINEVPYDN